MEKIIFFLWIPKCWPVCWVQSQDVEFVLVLENVADSRADACNTQLVWKKNMILTNAPTYWEKRKTQVRSHTLAWRCAFMYEFTAVQLQATEQPKYDHYFNYKEKTSSKLFYVQILEQRLKKGGQITWLQTIYNVREYIYLQHISPGSSQGKGSAQSDALLNITALTHYPLEFPYAAGCTQWTNSAWLTVPVFILIVYLIVLSLLECKTCQFNPRCMYLYFTMSKDSTDLAIISPFICRCGVPETGSTSGAYISLLTMDTSSCSMPGPSMA